MRAPARSAVKPKPALGLIILSLLFIWGFWRISGPFVELRRTKLTVSPLRAEKQRLQSENRLLKRDLQIIQSPEGMRIEAHKQGWLSPGERRMVFITPEKAAAERNLPAPVKPAWYSQVRTWARQKAEHLAKAIGY
jgi:hypothetical protein